MTISNHLYILKKTSKYIYNLIIYIEMKLLLLSHWSLLWISTPRVIKGTNSVISSDTSCKYGDARFTTLPFKTWSDWKCGRYSIVLTREYFFLQVSSLFFINIKYPSRMIRETTNNKTQFKVTKALIYPIHTWSDKTFHGTVVNLLLTSNYAYSPFKGTAGYAR